MSFSFSFTAPSKALAKAEAVQRMKDVVESQNIHQVDTSHVLRTVDGAIDLLKDEAKRDRQVYVNVSGSLGWEHNPGLPMEAQHITSSSVSASAYYTTAKV